MQTSRHRSALALAVVLTLASWPAQADDAQPVQEYAGISLYKTYCSVCHGAGAKGDGPMADQLRYRPTDLTQLARRNGGQFPAEDVFRAIDGRKPRKSHGGGDMPVWGDAFKNSREGYDEAAVKGKIDAVVEYLAGLQASEPAKK